MFDLKKTTAVILAGGLGLRLREVVGEEQKVMASVSGRPFIYYIFDSIDAAGIENVVLCTGYNADILEKMVGTSYKNLKISFSRELKPLGTGGALRFARNYLVGDHILVMNGDSYVVCDYQEFFDWHICKDAEVTILLTWVNQTDRYGSIVTDEKLRITTFLEKTPGKGSGWINAGVYLFQKGMIEQIPDDYPYSLEREFFPSLMENDIFGFPRKSSFIDIGTPGSYAIAGDFFESLS